MYWAVTIRLPDRAVLLARLRPSPDSAFRHAVTDAAIPFAVWHAALFGLAALANACLVPFVTTPASGAGSAEPPWTHFDANYYLGIADRGYSAGPGDEWAFYPLYPAVVRVLGYLGGGGHAAHVVVGLVVANLRRGGRRGGRGPANRRQRPRSYDRSSASPRPDGPDRVPRVRVGSHR